MNNINNELNQIMINATVRCMLNPDNGFFYLPKMKMLDIEKMFATMPESTRNDAVQGFFTAYHIARNIWEDKQQQINEILDVIDEQLEQLKKHPIEKQLRCPECACYGYVPGVKCPNCDYVD